ncbi:MAG: HU family DNA-binding protein [Flavimaricola sp.]|nr:HU family DNA-binding protein [Flavimaricola sp.]
MTKTNIPSTTIVEPQPSAIDMTVRVQVKMKEFLERVVARSGLKRNEAKSAAEATLAVLGEAIANGEEVNLPGLGKLKVNREKATDRGTVYVIRVVQNRPNEGGNEPLADQV